MWLNWLGAFSYLFAAVSAFVAACTYWQNSKQQRARWLFELYLKFYDSSSHTEIRKLIETGDIKFLDEKASGEDLPLKFDDYLNFFEFLTFLINQGRVGRTEALAMFDYPLRQLKMNNVLWAYVSRPEYGYEGLTLFLRELS